VSDALSQIADTVNEIDIEAVDGSEDAASVVEVLDELAGRLDALQPAVDSCLQRSESLLPMLAQQDREIIRKQSQVSQCDESV